MGSENSSIRDSIQTIVSSQQKTKNIVLQCEVVSVDQNKLTFSGRNIKGDGDEIIDGIRIGLGNTTNITQAPTVGSPVIVIKNVDDNSYYLLMTESVSDIYIQTSEDITDGKVYITGDYVSVEAVTTDMNLTAKNDITLNVDSGVVMLNGLGEGGVPMVDPLVTALNNVERRITDVINILNTWTPTGAPAADISSLKLLITNALLTPISPITSAIDLENPKVKQGSI